MELCLVKALETMCVSFKGKKAVIDYRYGATLSCSPTHSRLHQRGETTFEDKALNCELGGGKAAIIYNHSPGVIAGTLSDPTKSVIPVVGVSQEVGELLIASYLGQKVNLTSVDGYAFMDGTSMATPHVTGGVAEIWRSCPACSNEHVASCILSTALDLGSEGRDNEFGHGLLQTRYVSCSFIYCRRRLNRLYSACSLLFEPSFAATL